MIRNYQRLIEGEVMNGISMLGENIYHRRGDTGVIRVRMKLYENAPPFRFREGDKAVLSIKKRMKDQPYILQKETDDGFFMMRYEDTINIPFGVYVYDIKVKLKEGQYITVALGQYHLLPSVQGG